MKELGREASAIMRSGRGAFRPSAADKARVRQALHAQLAGPAPVLEPPPAPAAASGLGWPLVSLVVAGLAAGGIAWYVTQRGPEPATLALAPPAAVPKAPAPAEPMVVPPPASPAPERAAVQPSPADTAPPAQRRAANRLSEEVAILSRAETDLHAGRFASVLLLVAEHERKFPRGTLVQERVAAKIHALCGLGRKTEAQAELARLSPGSLQEGSAREACAPNAKP